VTAVVTGAAGFVGRSLVQHLLATGARVVGIDREPQPPQPGLTVLTAELGAYDERFGAALAGADAVFHLAGCPGVRDPRPDIDVLRRRDNVLATAAVLAAVPLRTPLVVTSSSSVYGGARTGRASREEDPLRPLGGYARSKVAVERLCAGRLAAGGRIVVARPFTVAGEGQRSDMALARWIEAARSGQPLRLLGSPARTRDITDVRQVAQALVALAGSGAQGPVNVGTGTGRSLARMVTAVARALQVEVATRLLPAGPAEVTDTRADTARLRRLIGWVPHTHLDALVARQVAALVAPPALGATPAMSAPAAAGDSLLVGVA
jgi:nucleoside-diphosphate-sugar epimerase